MTKIQECLARNIKFYRKELGISQMGLAERAGTAANYIALIEVGKSFPSLQMLEKIAGALEVDALDLFDKDCLKTIDSKHLKQEVLDSFTKSLDTVFNSYSIIE